MVNKQLQGKIDRSIKLIRLCAKDYDKPIEIAYSGGKDSDVILQLAKESGIRFEAIYKNTTIDPPGTIQHVKDMGVTILRPKRTFFEIVASKGMPTRWARFCCEELKEYKDKYDRVIVGVRREESRKRAELYKEPTECRYFGAKKEENRVEQIYPILDWTINDIVEFIKDRGIVCAPVYYDGGGKFHPERRLGCMGCPLKSNKDRIEQFQQYPKLLRQWCIAATKNITNHPNRRLTKYFKDGYENMYSQLFCISIQEFMQLKNNLFGEFDAKKELEDFFKTKL